MKLKCLRCKTILKDSITVKFPDQAAPKMPFTIAVRAFEMMTCTKCGHVEFIDKDAILGADE